MSFTIGQKVVCVDDNFPEGANRFYTQLPQRDRTYTIRNVCIGVDWNGQSGEVCVHLMELTNPRSDKPPHPERGFNAMRFAPVEEQLETAQGEKREEVAA
jgi:hypothetical protein